MLCQVIYILYIVDAIHGTFVHSKSKGGGRFLPIKRQHKSFNDASLSPPCESSLSLGQGEERGGGGKASAVLKNKDLQPYLVTKRIQCLKFILCRG